MPCVIYMGCTCTCRYIIFYHKHYIFAKRVKFYVITFTLYVQNQTNKCQHFSNGEYVNTHLQPEHLGYEPANLTVHPPPPKLLRVGSFFSYRCLVFPKKMSSKESLYLSELSRLKDPKTWFLSIFTQTKF